MDMWGSRLCLKGEIKRRSEKGIEPESRESREMKKGRLSALGLYLLFHLKKRMPTTTMTTLKPR